ncbi:hypothetical protein BC363_02315 [Ensifer sp. LC384]|nr:hypothetical protein BC363_02315 [Ensifer sp. LC384]
MPDCDDNSDLCPLRQTIREYARLSYHGAEVPDELRRRYSISHFELNGWRQKSRAMGGEE